MMNWQIIKSLVKSEKGQGMVEYALVVALIAVVVAAFIPGVADAISATFTAIKTALAGGSGA